MAQVINATGKTLLLRPSICSPRHTGFTGADSLHFLNSSIVAESHLMIVMRASPLSVLQFLIDPLKGKFPSMGETPTKEGGEGDREDEVKVKVEQNLDGGSFRVGATITCVQFLNKGKADFQRPPARGTVPRMEYPCCCCAQQMPVLSWSMRHTWVLIVLLAGLCFIGANTTQLIPAATDTGRLGWTIYLVVCPAALAGVVWFGWAWTAMACVMYGTVGLALDLATVTSLLTGQGETGALFLFSAISGVVNFLLILLGGSAFFRSALGNALPVSRPPNPPSPSSSARP